MKWKIGKSCGTLLAIYELDFLKRGWLWQQAMFVGVINNDFATKFAMLLTGHFDARDN
jgi:hypothetical protein